MPRGVPFDAIFCLTVILPFPLDEPASQPLSDGERRCFEQQISELVQNAETKKAEIASQKIEIRHLKEQVPKTMFRIVIA